MFDAFLTDESAAELEGARTELPFTEVKSEVAIDRATSAATPRTMERVPAGAEFGPVRLVVLRYEDDPPELFNLLLQGLELVEADYLGGSGSRGSGRVSFHDLQITERRWGARNGAGLRSFERFERLQGLMAAREELEDWLVTR